VRHIQFLATLSARTEPSSFKEVVKDFGERKNIHNEIYAFERNEI